VKKIIMAAIIVAVLSGQSCADSDKKAKNEENEKVKEMLSANRCLTCHHPEETINGPSYRDIALRYAGRPDTIVSHLTRKVINGGGGEWGEVYMTPQSHVSQTDAEKMVRYILSLK
jgi:cytochrome c